MDSKNCHFQKDTKENLVFNVMIELYSKSMNHIAFIIYFRDSKGISIRIQLQFFISTVGVRKQKLYNIKPRSSQTEIPLSHLAMFFTLALILNSKHIFAETRLHVGRHDCYGATAVD